MDDEIFISLGCDCSVSYQLRRLGLQKCGSLPFDWIRVDNLGNIVEILENKFDGFADIDMMEIKKQNDTFINFDCEKSDCENIKSLCKLKHNKYKFIMPHEFINMDLDIINFKNKYDRRIKRFNNICFDEKIKKNFIILVNNDKELYKIKLLQETLLAYKCINFNIKIINNNNYLHLIDNNFTWKRDYIPWETILFK